jgi:hypothetical protein
MDSKTYLEEAIKTESLNFEEIRKRIEDRTLQKELFSVLTRFSKVGSDLDFFKKFIFYGKNKRTTHFEDNFSNFCENLNLSDEDIRLIHAVLGIATEAQEMIDQIMNLWLNKSLDKVNLVEENGDLFWYQAIMSNVTNISFDELMEKNILKLRARYGEKFSSEKAINRDLDLERKILEQEK